MNLATATRNRLDIGPANTRQHRYWSPTAQPYASADQLLYRLEQGWTIDGPVEVETYWFGEARHILIYHMLLRHNEAKQVMRLLGNPSAVQIVHSEAMDLDLVPYRAPHQKINFEVINK